FLEVLGEVGLNGSGELNAACRACCRAGPYERAAFRAQEEVVAGLGRGRAGQNSKQGVDVRRPQDNERREFLAGGGLQPFVGREPLRDLARLLLGETGKAEQPLKIALVHRGERVRLRLKATYNASITMSIQSVNMWRSLGALPHGPVRIQREIEEDPLGAHPESSEEAGLVPGQQFRLTTLGREATEQRLPA